MIISLSLYEDNINDKLSDKLFEQMQHDFEVELEGLTESIAQDQQELDRISRETVNAEKFLALVKKYTDFSELTPAMISKTAPYRSLWTLTESLP